MFFDLSIPYLETLKSQPSTNKTLSLDRLKTLARVMELGYTAVAYDRAFAGVISDADRCKIPLFSLPSLVEVAPALLNSVKFHRECNGVSKSAVFRQYSRITISVDRMSVGSAFNARGVLRSYDLVAAKPLDQDAFDKSCQGIDVNIITLDFPLKFRLKLPMVEAAVKRGVHFEIKYSNLIGDVHVRRKMLSDARLLVNWTLGKNLIISSSATSLNDIRGPHDIVNLCSFLLGLSKERAKAAISGNCRSLIANALRKKDYKEAIRIEKISSDEQLDSESIWFGDCKDWDPISSGEGDLLPLDDISKLFSVVSEPPKTKSPAIDFSSCAKGFSLKDHISGAGKKHQVVGERKPLSDSTTRFSSSTDVVPVEDKKLLCVASLESQISSCKGVKVAARDMPRVFADSEEPALSVAFSSNEIIESSVQNNVASDAAGLLSSDTTLKPCTFAAKDSLLSPELSLTSASTVDEISVVCMEYVKDSDMPDAVAVSIETTKAVAELVDINLSDAAGRLSYNDKAAFSLKSLELIVPEEQVKEKEVEKEQTKENEVEKDQKDEVLSEDASLQIDRVQPSPREERENAYLSPDDVTFEDGFCEKKVKKKEALVDHDVCMEEVSVNLEDHNQLVSTAIDGCASSRLKSGRGRPKGRSAYPLPFKGLLKPMLFKKKSCQSRKSRRHLDALMF